jgi:DNA-binding IclR family transcriptional regulator
LVQPFTAQQLLERKFALLQQQNVFQRLTEPAFTMASDLACIIEDGLIKFKSQQKLRAIINLVEIYRAATDSEVETFAAQTNQTSRKLIHAVLKDGVLDHYQPTVIQQSASATGLDVALQAGKLAMPDDPAGTKALLQFLNESRYNGPLSGQAFVTHSQRRV